MKPRTKQMVLEILAGLTMYPIYESMFRDCYTAMVKKLITMHSPSRETISIVSKNYLMKLNQKRPKRVPKCVGIMAIQKKKGIQIQILHNTQKSKSAHYRAKRWV